MTLKKENAIRSIIKLGDSTGKGCPCFVPSKFKDINFFGTCPSSLNITTKKRLLINKNHSFIQKTTMSRFCPALFFLNKR